MWTAFEDPSGDTDSFKGQLRRRLMERDFDSQSGEEWALRVKLWFSGTMETESGENGVTDDTGRVVY